MEVRQSRVYNRHALLRFLAPEYEESGCCMGEFEAVESSKTRSVASQSELVVV